MTAEYAKDLEKTAEESNQAENSQDETEGMR